VGVTGPDGEVILYYKEGDFIIVKACEGNISLGTTPKEAKKFCQGKSNRVPIESFKAALRNLVSADRLDVYRPLTPQEVEAYRKDGPTLEEIKVLEIELEVINNFIRVYGAGNANLVRKEELIKALRSQETRASAINKINAEVDKAVNLIADQSLLTLSKVSSDKDQFLYTVLKKFNPNNYTCGLKGSVNQRIKNCSSQLNSEKAGFVLVTRSKDFHEVHKEISTGLLWSERLSSYSDHFRALKICRANLKEMAGLKVLDWRLPSIEEFEQAEKNGIRRALPNMNYLFWSTSKDPEHSDAAKMFNGIWGITGGYYRNKSGSVRCIAPTR
jgi:hypothetical protein